MRRRRIATFFLLLVLSCCATSLPAASSIEPTAPQGRFVRLHWFEPGIENGNPTYNSRFRVNAPEVVLDKEFMNRPEARANGMMLIKAEEDLGQLAGAELYLELWGGHPGTANKRVAVNGRKTYALPQNGTEERNCTHQYPTIPLKLTDLCNGYNAFQFACDQGTTFWGHFIIDNACLRVELKPDHPDLAKAGLAGFRAEAHGLSPLGDVPEINNMRLLCGPRFADKIAAVDYIAMYEGYDENGDGRIDDWHGFTQNRKPVAAAAHSETPPDFKASWDYSMIPKLEGMTIKAIVRFKDAPELIYETAPVRQGPPTRRGADVKVHYSKDLPRPFWSRADKPATCTITLDENPAAIERAQLHVVLWDGGAGTIKEPYKLNGRPVSVAGAGKHDVLYRTITIDPAQLRQGVNAIELLSDTEHHGIEVLLPGPALVVRSRRAAN